MRPLPPPAGTFELITRRARAPQAAQARGHRRVGRRGGRRGGLRRAGRAQPAPSQPPTNGPIAADGTSPTQHADPVARTGTAARQVAESVAGRDAAGYRACRPGPPGPAQLPADLGHVRARSTAWVIGQAGTPGTCANVDPYDLHLDGADRRRGQTWRAGPPPTPAPRAGQTGQRHQVPRPTTAGRSGPSCGPPTTAATPGRRSTPTAARVIDLETSGGRAYAVFATCAAAASAGFAADCTSYTLMTTTAGSGDWTGGRRSTNGLTNGGAATSAVLALTGSDGYLLAPDGTLYSGLIGGTWSRAEPRLASPGTPPRPTGFRAPPCSPADSTQLAIACNRTAATARRRGVHVDRQRRDLDSSRLPLVGISRAGP